MSKRKLPLWMRDAEQSPTPSVPKQSRFLSDAVQNGIITKGSETQSVKDVQEDEQKENQSTTLPEEDNTPRRRLRSNYKIPDDVQPKREATVKINIEDVPFIDYKGTIRYYTDWRDVACAADEIMQWVDKQPQVVVPIAFDLEWPFSFQTGPGPTALMQLCAELHCCYLFQLSCLKKLPAALLQLLHHPKVRLHGVNVKNDFRKLARDFPEANAETMIGQCVDLGQWYNRIHGSSGLWSMERLVLQVCRLRIDKNKKIGQEIYLKLEEKEQKLEQERQELDMALPAPTSEQ
ncbi:3'-5' exonuclease isoform X2 [Wyeomyia smithii]|uniref:3'-5' exonuclease isoform X2 n=1 Tax=Wyeomyia smithii TaxID=174621 RepID=UPI00246803ED|nr:3'-5' exonuclease isoform X2 [Wyeomyia smithii]